MSPRDRRPPLVSFSSTELQSLTSPYDPKLPSDDPDAVRKRWYHYLPLCGTVFFILAPQPSWLYVLVDFHLQTLRRPILFTIHLSVSYLLTFMAFSSLIVLVARDPGPVSFPPSRYDSNTNDDEGEEMGLMDALNDDDDFSSPGKWCRKCWGPKPERAHHCSFCNRCVLKMDHHCPWLGAKCIGHRTYPAFVHFLTCISFLSLYIAVVSGNALWYAFHNPFTIHEYTPIHELALTFMGAAFFIIVGSFAAYHIYLTYTNQTTIENITPFILLRHLPRLPPTGHTLSDPPLEPELSGAQRRLVKDAHQQIHLYDLGWRKNFSEVFGWNRPYGWVYRLWYGGASSGDGKTFPRNPRSQELLARLANELVKLDANR
ncbi:DHHC palmitoyltransferase-domain-containing protein [Panaeolus papilionaceus]|nr:DHHC palmitoyltransferase-domain-containing protein [Panaeolus papilionaceus]